jgi:2-keto-4-pentenoate hydratase
MSIAFIRFSFLPLLAATFALGRADGAPSPDNLERQVAAYYSLQPIDPPPAGTSMDDALDIQSRFLKALAKVSGKPVGHKVGLVTRESQAKYGLQSPVRGVLLSKMILENGATVPAKFGVNPLCEADLVAVVKSKKINDALTPFEVAKHLKEIVAFIELPDAYLDTNAPIDGAAMTAFNVGARFGVLGGRVKVEPTPQFVTALANMAIVTTDQDGTELSRAAGKTILDQPLHAILWLIEDLKRTGDKLNAGDLISLGGVFTLTPKAGQTISVTYSGLPGGPIRAVVTFK